MTKYISSFTIRTMNTFQKMLAEAKKKRPLIVAALRTDRPVVEIAQAFGISRQRAYQIKVEEGIEIDRRRRKHKRATE